MRYAVIEKRPTASEWMAEKNMALEKEIFYEIVIYTQRSYYTILQQNRKKAMELLEIVLKKNNIEKNKIQMITKKVKERFDEKPKAGVLKNITHRPEVAVLCGKTEEITRTTCQHIVDTYSQAQQIIKSARIVGNYGTFEIKEIDFSDKIEVLSEYESSVGNCFMMSMTSRAGEIRHLIHNIEYNNLEVDIPQNLLYQIEEYAIRNSFVPWRKIFKKGAIEVLIEHTPYIKIESEEN